MPYEAGGRADKSGNRYEIRWVIYQMIKVLQEKLDYVILEGIGDDEQGVDIWIGYKDGNREGQQCKGRNASKEKWDFGSINSKGIFTNWKLQLDRNKQTNVALVSPLSFIFMEDLNTRALNNNSNPQYFYNYQILESSKELIDFFQKFSKVMGLDYENDEDLSKCVDYIKRIKCRQIPDSELKEIITTKIGYLLIGDELNIYNAFTTWIIDGDILGKKITISVLYEFLNAYNIKLRNLSADNKIKPRIEQLNNEYRSLFNPLKKGLVDREEFSICRNSIKQGNSIIIHGKAGIGKSGCTEDIINYCKENIIPYLAIKLDKRIPSGSAQKWGEAMDLPASIAHCLDSISRNEKSVLILDQLDALRWTQSHSRDSLLVCTEIINQIIQLNLDREFKISIVFVCRTVDMENDNNIKSLFDNKKENIIWKKLRVMEFSEDIVKNVIGDNYDKLTFKLREMLRTPNNLYIWQQLETDKDYNECYMASHLIDKWWEQLVDKWENSNINGTNIMQAKECLVDNFVKIGRMYVPLKILTNHSICLKFLVSNGFLLIQSEKVSFVHQSILDSFLAEKMCNQYYNNEGIISIIGIKEKQTPGRRYQIQIFMQSLLEIDSEDFLNASKEILNSDQVRYYVKFLVFEILSQVEITDNNIKDFIIKYCEDDEYSVHIISNIIVGRPNFVRILRDNGILDKWFKINEKKDIAINLIRSIHKNYDLKDVEFIEKYSFRNQNDDERLGEILYNQPVNDTDSFFEFRMKYYENYPQFDIDYFDFNELMKSSQIRATRILVHLLDNHTQQDSNHNNLELDVNNVEIDPNNSLEILNMLLPYVPLDIQEVQSHSDWSGRYYFSTNFKRVCIEVIKKSNTALISLNPKVFFSLYQDFIGNGNSVFNEIILEAFCCLPKEYSDDIINYLCVNFEKCIFEDTSGNGNKLLLAKKIIAQHSKNCTDSIFMHIEKTIYEYVPLNICEIYKGRVDYNKEKGRNPEYWSFYGDLQFELLNSLQNERLSKQSLAFLNVLNRKFPAGTKKYIYSDGMSGVRSTPIDGKKLSNKSWLGILNNNNKINSRENRWKEHSGKFIDNSLEAFSRSFATAVSENPERMIKLVLSINKTIPNTYIDSMFSGIAFSKSMDNIPLKLLETIILKFEYDHNSFRAKNITEIIGKRCDDKWSQYTLNILKDIAANHIDPELENTNVLYNSKNEIITIQMLQSKMINCVRGQAAETISQLLWSDYGYFSEFEKTIKKIITDENPAVKMASLDILFPSYNIEKEWASEIILRLFEEDSRLVGHNGSKNILFLIYDQHRERVLNIAETCYNSNTDELIKIGSHIIAEMYLTKNEFLHELSNIENITELKANSIIEMMLIYFKQDEYNKLVKDTICLFIANSLPISKSISRIFYDDRIVLERDKELLLILMGSEFSSELLYPFIKFLERNSKSLIDYNDIILTMCQALINNKSSKNNYRFSLYLPKLIIGLYDETENSTDVKIKKVSNECLDIWDLMFKNQIGSTRVLSRELMER